MFPLLAKELFLAVGYFLDIEYDVIGNDLISLWLMMLSYLNIGLSLLDLPDQSLLTSPILDLGCQLVNLYSELRQVNNSIFTLCKAVRLLISHQDEGEMRCTRFFSNTKSLPNEVTAVSVGTLLCSQEFKLAIHHPIKSITEGQASELIQQLTADVLESMEWMKIGCSITDGKEIGRLDGIDHVMPSFHVQAELLGRVLSEIYMILLESLTVTAGNCSLLGPSVKELVSTIYPCISSLAGQHPDGVNKFLFSIMGMVVENEKEKHGISTQWMFVFLFRLYMSCRSLYRQIISLTPPSASQKLSSAMGDAFTAYTGRDWMEKSNWTDEGYFSWIINPSPSLLDLIHHISNTYINDNIEDCCPLIYVLHILAIQRLVDLNRHRSSLEYLLLQNEKPMQVKKLDDTELSPYSKKDRKLKRNILVLEQEAVELTDFMLGYLSLVANNHPSIFSSDDTSCEKMAPFEVQESDKWNFGICSVNKKSLPIAIWWIICQNIDVEKHKIDKDGQLKKITLYQISQGLLKDSIFYEQKFVRWNLASRFCHALENSVLLLFSGSSVSNKNFNSLPVWPEVLSALDNSSAVVSGRRYVKHDSATRSISNSSDGLSSEISMKQKAFPSNNVKFKDCKSLLNLLCWMPKGYLSLKSFSKLATCVLNLEWCFYSYYKLCEVSVDKSPLTFSGLVAELLDCQSMLSSYGFYELFQLFVACRRTLKNIIVASCEEKIEASLSSLLSVAEDSYFFTWLFKSVSAVVGLLDTMLEDCMPESKLKKFSLMDHTSYVFFAISKYQFGQAVLFIGNSEQPYSGVGSDQSISNKPALRVNYLKDSEALRCLSIIAESLKEQAESLLILLKGSLDNAKVGIENKAVNINKMSFTVSCFGGFLWGLASALNQASEKSGDLKAKLLRGKCEPLSKLNLCINVCVDFISDLLCMFLENDQQPRSDYDAQSSQKLDYRNLRVDGARLSMDKAPLLIDISQVMLLESANLGEIPPLFTFVWLDGAVKYLEELGRHIPLIDSNFNENAYAKLIELHLRAIGKCLSELFLSHGSHRLDEFKARLRMSFKVLFENPSELQLLSAIQAIERALVGAQGGHAKIYEITLKCQWRHEIFYRKLVSNEGDGNPDAGSVVLMCVEELTRVSGKHALFQMDPWHIGQCLRIPGALFQDFHQLRLSEAPVLSNSLLFLDKPNHDSIASTKYRVVDQEFSVNLFAACCQLLYTILKHHKREIDEALKLGVYALIDACSANDLQYLHTVFGGGPCRNTSASLQRDYKLNFQYEGKV
ncbi:hypothetical protein REPUB_Repub01dG0224500 [Reevesia pubescens]